MIIKYFKAFIITLLFFYQNSLYSKNIDNTEFNSKEISNYFSATVSYNNQKNTQSLEFFNLSKSLIDDHTPYFKKYIFALIIEGKVDRAIKELKNNFNKKNSKFFESYLLLTVDSIQKKDFEKSNRYLNELSKFKGDGTIELIIYETLKEYIYLFKNKKFLDNKITFGNLSAINKAFQSCYINEKKTEQYFINLINNYEIDYSRYIFFYTNYLINKKEFTQAQAIINNINTLNSNLLVLQTKNWIEQKKFYKFNQIFSCEEESDLISEFLFLIANLYSTQKNIEKSNFYMNISNFLNTKFKFNLSLLVENHYENNNFKQSKKILNKFNKSDDVYYWYKIKKKSNIIFKELGEKQSIDFINKKFKEISNPSIKILFDMANISKSFEKYKEAINYYNQIISRTSSNSDSYASLLFRRGGSYERLGKFEEADKDLLESLKFDENNAYVLNYLAYSWLERNYEIDRAIEMLEKAYNLKKKDPFILDSVGWAYYLVNKTTEAEKFLRKALELMPNDPVVNDHYGDVLWKMNRRIQAKYYWQSVLGFEDTKIKMKEDIKIKLLNGPEKI